MNLRVLIFALSICSLNAHAELNKWVDADGSVHYSDTIPPEVEKAQTLRNMAGKDQTAAPASFSAKSVAEREADLKKSKKEKEEAAMKKSQEKAQADLKRENCAASRENLRTLEESTRIVTHDANGERTYLDDAAREQRLNDTRKAISANCN
jgi:hypothetical protein